MKRTLAFFITIAVLMSALTGITVFANDVIYEDNFDGYLFDNPDGWTMPVGGYLQSKIAKTGKSIRLVDDTLSEYRHAKSEFIPVESGQIYSLTADIIHISGAAAKIYFKYFNADKKEIASLKGQTSEKEWTQVIITQKAPDDAAYCRVFLVSNTEDVLEACYDNIAIYKGIIVNKKTTALIPPTQNDPVDGKLIQPVGDKLQYNTYSDKNDKLSDFSTAGFYRGEYELPDSSKLPLAATIEPSKDVNADDTLRIQKVIDEVYDNSSNDLFKVIKVKAGRYNINSNGISLKSGIILSGEGQGPDGTVFYATDKKQYTVIKVTGNPPEKIGEHHYIQDDYIPSGSCKITLTDKDVKNYKVGDLITIYHKSTEEWNKAMDMVGVINVNNDDTSWVEGSADTKEERYIEKIEGNVITIDIPTFIPYEKKYSQPYIYKTDDSGRYEHIGIENLRIESYYNGDPNDENHANNGIRILGAKNCYVRDVTGKYLVVSLVQCDDGTKQVTVKNCSCVEPVSTVAGSRRYAFYAAEGSQQTYFTGCYSYNGRHCYMASKPSTGPTVFTDNVKDHSNAQSETHATWSTGTLYDNLFSISGGDGGWIGFTNRGIYGTQRSQGWTSAGTVAWNCLAHAIIGHKPPLNYQNFIIGEWGHYGDENSLALKNVSIQGSKKAYRTGSSIEHTEENYATSDDTSFVGDVYKESETAPVEPRSLYKAQLAERLTGSYKNFKPNAPVISSPRGEHEHAVTTNSVEIKGIYQKGAEKVTIYIDNTPFEAKLNNSDYTFALTAKLADGTHKIYATQTIDGIEGTKCADRFVVVKERNGNPSYLQSQYDYNMIHQLINDKVIPFDEYQNTVLNKIENDKITVVVNGKNLISDVDPVEINGRVLVPMRAIFEKFDAEINWDEKTKTATATKDGRVVQVTEDSKITKVDGKEVEIDVPATIINGRFLVPVRFISESFGATVGWNGLRKMVTITGGTVIYPPVHGLTNELGIYSAVQSGDDGAGAVIANVFDNDPKTSWGVSIDNTNGSYGILDVGSSKNIKDFYMAFNRGNQRVYTFDILISEDGVNYTTVYDHKSSSGETLEFEVYPINAKGRYIKIVGYGNNTNQWNNFTEMAVTENK